jgi:hypothetical protein
MMEIENQKSFMQTRTVKTISSIGNVFFDVKTNTFNDVPNEH